MSRPARRLNTASPLDTIVLANHQTMTAPQMSEKFGYHVSSFHKAARRVGVTILAMNATDVVKKYHAEMTVYEMMEKFGFSHSHLKNVAKELDVKIKPLRAGRPRVEKSAKTVLPKVPRIKPERAKVVEPPLKKVPAKPRKESNSKNPDRFKLKNVDYSTMRMLPVGIDNQYFYVSQDASEKEIAQERARRRERIEVKKEREKLSPIKS